MMKERRNIRGAVRKEKRKKRYNKRSKKEKYYKRAVEKKRE